MPVFLLTAGRWLLSNPWRTACIALMIAVSFYRFVAMPALHLKIAHRDTEIAQLHGAIDVQNHSIIQMKRATDQANANQRAALAEAKKAMDAAKVKSKVILERPVPTPDKECKSTLDLLKEFQL